MKIRIIADFEIPDNTIDTPKDEQWIVTNGDGGYNHMCEELWHATYKEAECAHLKYAVDYLAGELGESFPKDTIHQIVDSHKEWAKIIREAKLKFERI